MNLRTFWLVLDAAIIWSLVMTWEAAEFKKQDCSSLQGKTRSECKYGSMIAALELARDESEFRLLIDQGDSTANELWNSQIVRVNTYMDFLFIALYWRVFVLLARLQGTRFGMIVGLLISLTAASDIAENIRLLQALGGVVSHESQFPLPGFVSEAKWILFAISTTALGISLAANRNLWPIIMSILMLVSALLTIFSVFHPVLLAPAVTVLFVAFLIATFYYFPFGGSHPNGRAKNALLP